MQAMVDEDLPIELRNTWQIRLDQIQLVLEDDQQPVTLGRGAYGTVSLCIPSSSLPHFQGLAQEWAFVLNLMMICLGYPGLSCGTS